MPSSIRMQIIEMAAQGTRPCVISRKLRVSHGCVSKILQRYAETGSIKPGSIGGSKPRSTTPLIEAKMDMYRKECPTILCYEIRRRLIEENVCDQLTVPSVSAIAKYLRNTKTNENNNNDNNIKEEMSYNNRFQNSMSNSESECDYFESDNKNENNNNNLANVISITHSRRLRTSFTTKQIELLESIFNQTHYPDQNLREDIAQTTGLTDNKIQIWFSNRRAKWRKGAINDTTNSFSVIANAVATAVANGNNTTPVLNTCNQDSNLNNNAYLSTSSSLSSSSSSSSSNEYVHSDYQFNQRQYNNNQTMQQPMNQLNSSPIISHHHFHQSTPTNLSCSNINNNNNNNQLIQQSSSLVKPIPLINYSFTNSSMSNNNSNLNLNLNVNFNLNNNNSRSQADETTNLTSNQYSTDPSATMSSSNTYNAYSNLNYNNNNKINSPKTPYYNQYYYNNNNCQNNQYLFNNKEVNIYILNKNMVFLK